MKIINLTDVQFDEYSKNHPLHTYFQTSAYAKVMNKCGYGIKFWGFMEKDNMIGAAMILCGKLFANYKYAYSPRGMLINYVNEEEVRIITSAVKNSLAHEGFVFLKIDPPIMDYKHDQDGNVIAKANVSSHQILLKNNYTHFGNNLFFETLKPRWNAIINLSEEKPTVLDSFNKSTRNKIKKATSRGIDVTKLDVNSLPRFYNFVAKKHYRRINYYSDMCAFFGDNFEMYVAQLDTNSYLKSVQKIYDKGQAENEELNYKIQTIPNNSDLITRKMESDKIINANKEELKKATDLLAKFPDMLDIGAIAIIKTPKVIYLLIDGFDKSYSLIYPSFYLKWFIIDKYVSLGYKVFNLNGISGEFNKINKFSGLTDMKLGFNAEVCEYIGEYDLIINPTIYKLHAKTGNAIMKKNYK